MSSGVPAITLSRQRYCPKLVTGPWHRKLSFTIYGHLRALSSSAILTRPPVEPPFIIYGIGRLLVFVVTVKPLNVWFVLFVLFCSFCFVCFVLFVLFVSCSVVCWEMNDRSYYSRLQNIPLVVYSGR